MNTSNFSDQGLPDLEQLARLANQYFAALPNESVSPDQGVAANSGQTGPSPRSVAPAAGGQNGVYHVAPSDTGKELPGGVPSASTALPSGSIPAATAGAPGAGLSHGSVQLPEGTGVPSSVPAQTTALNSGVAPAGISNIALPQPQKPHLGASPGSYPAHLFVPAPNNLPLPVADTGIGGVPGSAPVSLHGYQADFIPQGLGLPGAAELASLLQPRRFSAASHAAPVARPQAGDPGYYFLDHQRVARPGLSVPGLHKDSLFASAGQASKAPFDINQVRRDFPILQERVEGRQLVWLDNAATTQKPLAVIDRLKYFYEHENSNIHRAAHTLAARATDAYEAAREKVRAFLNAASTNEIVFVRGTTEAINLVAQSWGRQFVGKDDEIIISHLEHHANIVPWQQLCAATGAKLRVIPVDDDGQIILSEYEKLLTPRTKLVSVTQVSNALGTITPARRIVELAHHIGARVLIDGAQSVSHMRADVRDLDADWFVFSGHKVFGPTGIGVLYGKEDLLNETQPWQGGGNMIKDVTFEHTEYHPAPTRFEAGTGNIADAVGLGAALDYVNSIGIGNIYAYEHQLLQYATGLLRQIPGVRLIGTAADKASVLSFVLDAFKTEEVGAALAKNGIAVRSGHHCAQPILRRFGLEATVRPSLAFYNNCADVDALITTLQRLTSGQQRY